jgi:hypothetical protein
VERERQDIPDYDPSDPDLDRRDDEEEEDERDGENEEDLEYA